MDLRIVDVGRRFGRLAYRAVLAWFDDDVPRLAAGLAYYTSFSIAPLVFLSVLVLSRVYENAEAELLGQLTVLIPGGGIDAIEVMLEGLQKRRGAGLAAGIGIATLWLGASAVFGALQDALNEIWQLEVKSRAGWRTFLSRRLFSFAMVLIVAFLFLVSLMLNSFLALLVARFGNALPGGAVLWSLLNIALALVSATVIFALLFKYVPDAPVAWRAALVGGAVTALLFSVGEALLAWYLGDAARLSAYGVFGSLIVLLLWVYYSAQIVLLGAEFTKVYEQGR